MCKKVFNALTHFGQSVGSASKADNWELQYFCVKQSSLKANHSSGRSRNVTKVHSLVSVTWHLFSISMLCNLLWSVFGVVVWSDPDSFLGVVCLEERTLWWWGNKARQVDQRVERTVIRLRGRGLDAPLFGSVEPVLLIYCLPDIFQQKVILGLGVWEDMEFDSFNYFFCVIKCYLVIRSIVEDWR